LTDERAKTISEWTMPTNQKLMQRFLGATIYFSPFVPRFADLSAGLSEMVHKKFDWNSSLWTKDYTAIFNTFKQALLHSWMIHYPDYSLDWELCTDASLLGVCGVLYQISWMDGPNGTPMKKVRQPIAVVSQKFSEQAVKWATIEQECYGIFYSVHALSHMLMLKKFVIHTDHNNLLWMEKSIVPKIVRWRIYLMQFDFLIKHIPGRDNIAADFGSRYFTQLQDTETLVIPQSTSEWTLDYVFSQGVKLSYLPEVPTGNERNLG
jgi:hypothetical protein